MFKLFYLAFLYLGIFILVGLFYRQNVIFSGMLSHHSSIKNRTHQCGIMSVVKVGESVKYGSLSDRELMVIERSRTVVTHLQPSGTLCKLVCKLWLMRLPYCLFYLD